MKQLYPAGTFIFLILLFFKGIIYAQDLVSSRQSSAVTFIYKITNEEAENIYSSGYTVTDTSYFHTLVDTYPTDSIYTKDLPKGHYIRRYAFRNKEMLEISTIQEIDVFVLNNNSDLRIRIYDREGRIVDDADVFIGKKKLKFYPSAQTYTHKKSNRNGLLKVSKNGLATFYALNRDYNNSGIKRAGRKVLYGTPLKYIWRPVSFVINIPIDGIKSIRRHYVTGSIAKLRYFFVNSYERVACIFDRYYCNDNNEYKFEQNHNGYLVFNKPKFRPGDTVKIKAFILKKGRKPVNDPAEVSIYNHGKSIILGKTTPYAPGGHTFEFVLHDSLDLELDRYLTVTLSNRKNLDYIRNSFQYEDYELKSIKLSVRTSSKNHYRNDSLNFFIKATDDNDLNLLDGRVRVIATAKQLHKVYTDRDFIPDTLMYEERNLEPRGETRFTISDNGFPTADFDYDIAALLLTSDNENVSASESVNYSYNSNDITVELNNDSVSFRYLTGKNANPNEDVVIFGEDRFGNKTHLYNGSLPVSKKVNPYFVRYSAETPEHSKSIEIADHPSLLKSLSKRTADSVLIVIENPRKIPFTYNLYRKNRELLEGYTDSLSVSKKVKSNKTFFLSLRYLWAGEIIEEDYGIPLFDKKLEIDVVHPQLVYPGQTATIDITVTDINGKPVKDVDLTAYGITSKFGHEPEVLPYLGKDRGGKGVINNFEIDDISLSEFNGLNLNYDTWKIISGVDSIAYYNFIYPDSGRYEYRYASPDSISQFAPFAVDEGEILPIHVIYLDNEPIYFSWSTNLQPYSFRASPGYHQIRLRTTEHEISIDSVLVEPNERLIFSIDIHKPQPQIRIRKLGSSLSYQEKNRLYPYIFPYKNNFGNRYAYLENSKSITFLKSASTGNSHKLAGPVAGAPTFHLLDSFKIEFDHEPFMEYEFLPALLKMRNIDKDLLPDKLTYRANANLGDLVVTEKWLRQSWKYFICKTK